MVQNENLTVKTKILRAISMKKMLNCLNFTQKR